MQFEIDWQVFVMYIEICEANSNLAGFESNLKLMLSVLFERFVRSNKVVILRATTNVVQNFQLLHLLYSVISKEMATYGNQISNMLKTLSSCFIAEATGLVPKGTLTITWVILQIINLRRQKLPIYFVNLENQSKVNL